MPFFTHNNVFLRLNSGWYKCVYRYWCNA